MKKQTFCLFCYFKLPSVTLQPTLGIVEKYLARHEQKKSGLFSVFKNFGFIDCWTKINLGEICNNTSNSYIPSAREVFDLKVEGA